MNKILNYFKTKFNFLDLFFITSYVASIEFVIFAAIITK